MGKSDMRALVGRERETHILDLLLDQLHEHGGALLIRGEAGIGKSALIAYAAEQAHVHGMQVLTATGAESESYLPFAGLHQLLRPIVADVATLPDHLRDALLAAFGFTQTPEPNHFLIAMAALELLSAAAARSPLLVIADDAQWLDRSTRDALAFVARRLEADRIGLLIGLRDGFDTLFNAVRLSELHVIGLDAASSGALLDLHTPVLAPSVRARLLADAAGNPLALLELPYALSASQRAGEAALPEWLPLSTHLEHVFGTMISRLPLATRTLLIAAAISESGSLAETLSAAGRMDPAAGQPAALEPAVTAHLIEIDDYTFRFRHPVMRSAAYQDASVTERLAAHAATAAVLSAQPDRSVWHRAASLMGSDEAVAAELEALATRAEQRGAHGLAVAALERSAQLTTNHVHRSTWLLRAAMLAFEMGWRDLGMRLLQTVDSTDLGRIERTKLLWLREVYGEAGVWSGSASVEAFIDIAEQLRRDGNTKLALEALLTIAMRCWWANPDQATRNLVISAAERIAIPADHPVRLAILALAAPIERGANVIDQLARVPADDAYGGGDFEIAYLLGAAANAVGDCSTAARLLATGIVGIRAQGRLGLLAQVLVLQAWNALLLGAFPVAMPAAAEAVRLTRETGQKVWLPTAQLAEAVLAALRGEQIVAEATATEAEKLLLQVGVNPMLALVQLARGVASLGAGHYATAYAQLSRIFDPTDSAYHLYVRCWVISDLVEAAAHSGHQDEARQVVAELETLATQTRAPHLLARLSYARPSLADDDATAEELYQHGIEVDLAQWPFLRARLQLAYGIWLRRRRRIAEARVPLRAAREAFDALGTIPWGERARQELRASGETSRKRMPGVLDHLSPQELQIAQMAAEGLTNREIGQQLYLSHRTIGFHLYRIFPKLGITSRAELTKALGSQAIS